METLAIFTFHSTHHALKAEQILKAARINVVVLPVPKDIASDCGIAMGVAPDDQLRAEDALNNATITPHGLHKWTRRKENSNEH